MDRIRVLWIVALVFLFLVPFVLILGLMKEANLLEEINFLDGNIKTLKSVYYINQSITGTTTAVITISSNSRLLNSKTILSYLHFDEIPPQLFPTV